MSTIEEELGSDASVVIPGRSANAREIRSGVEGGLLVLIVYEAPPGGGTSPDRGVLRTLFEGKRFEPTAGDAH